MALNALSKLCHRHIVGVKCQFHAKRVLCGGAIVVDGRWQREGIEEMIAAAVGGKRRVLSEEGARSHDGRGGLALGPRQPSPRRIPFRVRFRRR